MSNAQAISSGGANVKQHTQPVIDQHIQHLRDALDRLEDRIAQLGGKISPVLAPSSPCGLEETKSPLGSSDVAQQLHSLEMRVSGTTSHIEDIISRVEV